jgi:hypothetical protein
MRENTRKCNTARQWLDIFRQDQGRQHQTLPLKCSFLLTFFVLLTSCGLPNQTARSTQNMATQPSSAQNTVAPSRKITWMINSAALASLQTTGASWSQADSRRFFDNANTYVLGTMPVGWHSISTRSFTSYAALQAAFAAGSIPPSVQAIVYDNEAWSFTPVQEQQHFALYVQKAANLVHSHHMQLIATPGTDLVRALDPGGQGSVYSRVLSLNIMKAAAQAADVVEIQAQGSEASLSTYTSFVQAAAAQAKTANPNVVILAGLSTNPGGQKVTGQQLYAAFQATFGTVSGYWLNIPSNQGGYCPACGTPQPQVAIAFLRML